MLRRTAIKLLGAGALMTLGSVTRVARASTVIKVATLAPKTSPWGQTFTVWAEAVHKKSAGAVELELFYGGQQGDEGAMVGKLKDGQLQGAFLSGVGLSKIYKPILALQMPGLFASWTKLDAARDALKSELEKGVKDAGFTMVGWGDIGTTRLMSKGFEVHTPDDLKNKKPYLWRDDAIDPVFFGAIGGVTPTPLNAPEVLPNLDTGAVNVVTSCALMAEQMHWNSRLDTISDDATAFAMGGLVLSSKLALSADQRDLLLDTGRVTMTALAKRLRSEDDAAFARLKGTMSVVNRSADEKAKWTTLYKTVRQKLAQGTFAPDLVTKLETLAR